MNVVNCWKSVKYISWKQAEIKKKLVLINFADFYSTMNSRKWNDLLNRLI